MACEDRTVCCNAVSNCAEISKTYPSEQLSKHLLNLAARAPFLGILLGCVLIFFICAAISYSKLRNKLPRAPFKVREDFQEDSARKFLLTSDKVGWFVTLLAGASRMGVIVLFVKSSDLSSGVSDAECSFAYLRHESECGSDKAIDDPGSAMLAILLLAFLSKDFVNGKMIVHEGATRRDIKGSFAGVFAIFLTAPSTMISTICNQSAGTLNSGIIEDAAILLFLNETSDQFLNILKRALPS